MAVHCSSPVGGFCTEKAAWLAAELVVSGTYILLAVPGLQMRAGRNILLAVPGLQGRAGRAGRALLPVVAAQPESTLTHISRDVEQVVWYMSVPGIPGVGRDLVKRWHGAVSIIYFSMTIDRQ